MSTSRKFKQYKFSSPAGDLQCIDKFLNTHAIPEWTELDRILKQLFKIESSVMHALDSYDQTLSLHFSQQQQMIQKLAARCHNLRERRNVINLAEAAETLANSSPYKSDEEIAVESTELLKRIRNFAQSHRPSRNNAKFIRFARACIAKAEKHEPVLTKKSPKQVSLDLVRKNLPVQEATEIAELLYELASLLYQGNLEEFAKILSSNFSVEIQKEIKYHIYVCKGELQLISKREQQLKIVQGVLGYAHLLADYYMDHTPYPTIVEIHHIFQDLDFINHLEKADPQVK